MFRHKKSRIGFVAVAALVVGAAVVGGAVAAFPQDNVKLYTGCLTSGGTLIYVAEGDNPVQACASPKQVVKLSGGDITSLSVTAPLTGGGTNGAVSIGLDASATLPACSANNAVPKWNLSTSRWTCGADNDTTYSAGTGLSLSGTQFSIASDYQVKNNKSCASGKFANGIDSSGVISCATPAANAITVAVENGENQGIPDTGFYVDVARLLLAPGTYFAIAHAEVTSEQNVSGVAPLNCSLNDRSPDAGDQLDLFFLDETTLNSVRTVPFTLTGLFHVQENDEIDLKCQARDGADGVGVEEARINTLRIG